MQVQSEAKPYDTINVTPMLDLAYVLLVVFILMTTASVQGIPISMPKPSAKPPTEKHELHVIAINSDGSFKLDGTPKSGQQMHADLATIKSRDAQAAVVIQGDPKVHYTQVVSMIDLCNEIQIGLSLATSRIGY